MAIQQTQQTWRLRDTYCINVYKIGFRCCVHIKFTILFRSGSAAGVTAVLIKCIQVGAPEGSGDLINNLNA